MSDLPRHGLRGPVADQAAADAFHEHLDACQQCREHPFDPCATGHEMLVATLPFKLGDRRASPYAGLIERGWRDYAVKNLPAGCAPFHLKAARRAYYGGWRAMLSHLKSFCNDADYATFAADLQSMLSEMMKDLVEFQQAVEERLV